MTERNLPGAMEQGPPTGSVVAIDWGGSSQEIWVSDKHNIGNWYSLDVPFRSGDRHPTWYDVAKRAEGCTLTLLVPADRDAYAAGYDAGVAKAIDAVSSATEELRLFANGNYPDDDA